jgi:hypothetical protein
MGKSCFVQCSKFRRTFVELRLIAGRVWRCLCGTPDVVALMAAAIMKGRRLLRRDTLYSGRSLCTFGVNLLLFQKHNSAKIFIVLPLLRCETIHYPSSNFTSSPHLPVGPDSSVSIVTRYVAGRSGDRIPVWGVARFFRISPDRPLGPTRSPIQ